LLLSHSGDKIRLESKTSKMQKLTLAAATIIVDQALVKARELKLAPIAVAVLDSGGHLVVLKREDNASLLRPQIASGKAYGVLALGFGGRELARRAARSPVFVGALSDLTGGHFIPVQGGVLIRAGGEIVGSVGISGDTSALDEECALAGIMAAGLEADTGDPQ
jgi:uncharacterized protein GlcG (DUF336 family)